VAENSRLATDLAAVNLKIKQMGDDQQKLTQQAADLQLALDREKRSRATAESEKRATEVREGELSRQVSTLKAERSTLMVDLDATRRQVALVQAAHAKAAETANRNYCPVSIESMGGFAVHSARDVFHLRGWRSTS
jgi:hypothetical protein